MYRRLDPRRSALGPTLVALAAGLAHADEPPEEVRDEIVVISKPRVLGHTHGGLVPAHVQEIGAEALDAHALGPLPQLLTQQIAGAALSDTQGSPFNATLSLRGYASSPVLGVPQGVSVFQDGVRRNDVFGDVVHWALVPDFAVQRIEVLPGAQPLYGPNAQGGAVLLETKDGFTAPGGRLSLDSSTHPAGEATLEYGANTGELALYAGARGLYDAGWRDHSPADLQQGFVDLARRGERGELHLSLGLAQADYIGNGPAPRELLDEDRRAVFTRPDQSTGRSVDVALRGTRMLGEHTSLAGTFAFRQTGFATLNGDEAEFEACTGIAGDPDVLCVDAGEPDEAVLVDNAGSAVSSELEITGVENRTRTRSRAVSAVFQLADSRRLRGLQNYATAGVSADLGFSDYLARTRAGELDPTREVHDLGFDLGGDDFRTRLGASSRALGVNAGNTLFLTERLSATLSARLNHVFVDLDDLRGSDLNGSHVFYRVNPAFGLGATLLPGLQVYANYAEGSRAPTPAELGCADPERGCRVPNAFTADPPLDQVVTRGVEIGLRGALSRPLALRGSLAGFASWNDDDILFIASGPVLGSGYFANAGRTRRIGAELSLDARWRRLTGSLRYGFLEATFDSSQEFLSPSHPDADENGRIRARRGDRLPNLPRHSMAASASYALTPTWTLLARAQAVSSRRYQGDESNQLSSLPAYGVLDLETHYRVGERIALKLAVANVLDAEYATAGVIGDPSEVFPDFDDPRFQTPAAPRTFQAALRGAF